MPGITPKVLEFADRVVGDRVHRRAAAPVRRARPRPDPSASGAASSTAARYGLSSIVPACISREFTRAGDGPDLAGGRLAARARRGRARACGGPGRRRGRHVLHRWLRAGDGDRPGLLAPVLSQPSLPIGRSRKKQKRAIDISPSRPRRREAPLRGRGPHGARPALQGRPVRAAASASSSCASELGDAFVAVELDDERRQPRRRDDAALGADRAPHRRARPAHHATRSTRSSTCSAPACSWTVRSYCSQVNAPARPRGGDVERILTGRAIRGFADGFVSVLLAQYLTALGFSPVQVGAIVTGTLLGSAALTLGVRPDRRTATSCARCSLAATRADGRDRHRLRRRHLVLAVARRRGGRHAQPVGRRRQRVPPDRAGVRRRVTSTRRADRASSRCTTSPRSSPARVGALLSGVPECARPARRAGTSTTAQRRASSSTRSPAS